MSEAFDAAYYARFYGEPETRVGCADSTAKLARFVAAYLDYLEIRPETALDFGCGLGLWRAPLEQAFPGLSYFGVELSEHMCEARGWAQGSVVDYEHDEEVDLVICQGVLQYLRPREARQAIHNLARHCRGALYLEVLTREDWEHNCDREITDGEVFLRPVDWYRQVLAPRFRSCGGGLFVPRHGGTVLYELERGLE
jgi:hypothetical protein